MPKLMLYGCIPFALVCVCVCVCVCVWQSTSIILWCLVVYSQCQNSVWQRSIMYHLLGVSFFQGWKVCVHVDDIREPTVECKRNYCIRNSYTTYCNGLVPFHAQSANVKLHNTRHLSQITGMNTPWYFSYSGMGSAVCACPMRQAPETCCPHIMGHIRCLEEVLQSVNNYVQQ